MSSVLEPRNRGLMGRERYREMYTSGFEIVAYVGQQYNGWDECFAKLQEMRNYQIDWDDEGGLPPLPPTIAQAIRVAKALKSSRSPGPTRCHATDEGNIIISWEDIENYFELEIDASLHCVGRWLESGATLAHSATIEEFSQSY
jgi:hypothetical protein